MDNYSLGMYVTIPVTMFVLILMKEIGIFDGDDRADGVCWIIITSLFAGIFWPMVLFIGGGILAVLVIYGIVYGLANLLLNKVVNNKVRLEVHGKVNSKSKNWQYESGKNYIIKTSPNRKAIYYNEKIEEFFCECGEPVYESSYKDEYLNKCYSCGEVIIWGKLGQWSKYCESKCEYCQEERGTNISECKSCGADIIPAIR